jgi:hypothetical protein
MQMRYLPGGFHQFVRSNQQSDVVSRYVLPPSKQFFQQPVQHAHRVPDFFIESQPNSFT